MTFVGVVVVVVVVGTEAVVGVVGVVGVVPHGPSVSPWARCASTSALLSKVSSICAGVPGLWHTVTRVLCALADRASDDVAPRPRARPSATALPRPSLRDDFRTADSSAEWFLVASYHVSPSSASAC
jgi:hypothetical protein